MPSPVLVSLDEADLAPAQRLVAAAGWNQVLADWQMFLADGRLFGCKDEAGQVIATAGMMPYRDVGWISLMLVNEHWRRRGLATRLMTACIEALEGKGLAPALDATPMGREVYVQMGFHDVLPLTRWLAAAPVVSESTVGNVRPFLPADLPSALALDLACFGGGRRRLFERLLRRSAAFACVAESAGGVTGFLLGREGRIATHLGPLFAPDLPTAAALVEHALAHQPGPAIVDVPDARNDWVDWLRERGFGQVRPIMRMARGERPATLGGERLYAVAGPDLG